jgi:outer membrane biosynthesis protein TonB
MKRLKCKWIPIILAFTFMLAQLPAQEPLRAGIDVPEPKLIKKMEAAYPNAAIISDEQPGFVVLSVLINEQGDVTDITPRHHRHVFLEAAESAVMQWRFAPTFVDGKAVPAVTRRHAV